MHAHTRTRTEEDEKGLLEASVFLDRNECETVIPASAGAVGCTTDEVRVRVQRSARRVASRCVLCDRAVCTSVSRCVFVYTTGAKLNLARRSAMPAAAT